MCVYYCKYVDTEGLLYNASEMAEVKRDMHSRADVEISWFILRLMREQHYHKTIQVLHAFHDRIRINEPVTDVHGTRVT